MNAKPQRREFITLTGLAGVLALAHPSAARTEPQAKVLRVGFVGAQPREAAIYAAFLKRMAELGYQEGRNFAFEYIQTPNVEGYEQGYRALAERKLDIFLAVGNEAALRAARAAAPDSAPIAFLAVDFDPQAKGYVTSLARPGGNITGLSAQQSDTASKRVEILRQAVPNLQRLAIMANLADAGIKLEIAEVEAAAGTLGLGVTMADVRRAEDRPVLAQNSIWRDGGRDGQRPALPISRRSTLIAMMQAADLREGDNVMACGGELYRTRPGTILVE
jgi:ABC-type uncharacterized transport system substrate-binding protein